MKIIFDNPWELTETFLNKFVDKAKVGELFTFSVCGVETKGLIHSIKIEHKPQGVYGIKYLHIAIEVNEIETMREAMEQND